MSSHRVSTLSTAHPEPLCVHFSSNSRTRGRALSSASLISPALMRASCLWRRTGSRFSSAPSGRSFRREILRASWNFTPLRATISSVILLRICGRTSSRKAFGSAPRDAPGGRSSAIPAGTSLLPREFCERRAFHFYSLL